jgi:hypothetical protein
MKISLLAMLRERKAQLSNFFPCFLGGRPKLYFLGSSPLGELPGTWMEDCIVSNLKLLLCDTK